MKERIDQAAEWISHAKAVVVFAGAGLSTESGIPDFRSPGGVWDRYNPEDFYFQNFLASESSREKYWQMTTEMYEPMKEARPNAAHQAIVELEVLGKLDCVITQNIDGLHHKAGNSEERIIELHGTALYVSCLSCKKRYDRDEIQERVRQGQKAPRCDSCGGFLKPATISFGQPMPDTAMRRAQDFTLSCNLFLAIASSLVVWPAAGFPLMAKRNGARLIIINREPTDFDDIADLVVRGDIGTVLEPFV